MKTVSTSPGPASEPLRARGLDFWAGFWCLADPKISLASVASMVVGVCGAAALGPIHWGWLLLTVAGIFAIEVAKNASGEIFDFDSGTDQAVADQDRSPFSGGKRVLVDGLLTRRQTVAIAAVAYAIGVGTGLWIVFQRDFQVLWIGLLGVGCAYFYHAPPLKLSYRGLGELAVGLCYGPLIAAGTCLVQRGFVPRSVTFPAVSLGLLIAAFLWVNEFPDHDADRASGKRTLVVQLGRERASGVFAWIVCLAFAWLLVLPLLGLPWTVAGGLVGLLPALDAIQRLRRDFNNTPEVIPAQARTLMAFVLFALGAGAGLLMAGR